MYLKVDRKSKLFDELLSIFVNEQKRDANFKQWQQDNLPPFNNQILTEHSFYTLYDYVVGWKFEDDVDLKVWQPFKGYDGYYEPNKRTKAGKEMREKIADAQGKMFNRLLFFDIFNTKVPRYGEPFKVPNGFVFDGVVYMLFDDGNYNDIKTECGGQYTEITHGEFEDVLAKYQKDDEKTDE